jgi:small subunit ribosomal protein S6
MREYELTVVYDLSVAEAGGPEAGPQRLATLVEGRGGKMLKVDHWGRRRMAYPIERAIDGDYVVTRIDFEPAAVASLEAALKIDERVYRHLIVRADELPPPPPVREPREPRPMQEAAPVAAPEATDEAAVATEAPVAIEAAEAEAPASQVPADTEPIEAVVADAKAEVSPDEEPPVVENADVGGEASPESEAEAAEDPAAEK